MCANKIFASFAALASEHTFHTHTHAGIRTGRFWTLHTLGCIKNNEKCMHCITPIVQYNDDDEINSLWTSIKLEIIHFYAWTRAVSLRCLAVPRKKMCAMTSFFFFLLPKTLNHSESPQATALLLVLLSIHFFDGAQITKLCGIVWNLVFSLCTKFLIFRWPESERCKYWIQIKPTNSFRCTRFQKGIVINGIVGCVCV